MKDEPLVIKPRRPNGEDGYQTFSVRVREKIVAKLDALCAQTNRSRNELIGLFPEYTADRCIVEKPQQALPNKTAFPG